MIRSASETVLSDRVRQHLESNAQPPPQLREYGVGAQILSDLGVRKMVLLSNTQRSIIGLEGHDLEITEQRPITMSKDDVIPVRGSFYG